MQGNRFYFSLEYDEGEETEGGCLYRKSNGRFHALPGYPQCILVSGVVNFFLARTDSIQKSRFDPLLKRVAHSGESETFLCCKIKVQVGYVHYFFSFCSL